MGLGDLAEGFREKTSGIWGKTTSLVKRYRAFIIAGLALMLIAPLTAIAVVSIREAKTKGKTVEERPLFEEREITDDALFLPDEPDFVPGVILQEERRTFWTAEDAERFWRDPLQTEGAQQLREDYSRAVDRLLERVP